MSLPRKEDPATQAALLQIAKLKTQFSKDPRTGPIVEALKAIELNNAHNGVVLRELGYFYEVTLRRTAPAFQLYLKASAEGDLTAKYYVGYCYKAKPPIGVPKDPKDPNGLENDAKGTAYWIDAANLGHEMSIARLATDFIQQALSIKSYEKSAIIWSKRAAMIDIDRDVSKLDKFAQQEFEALKELVENAQKYLKSKNIKLDANDTKAGISAAGPAVGANVPPALAPNAFGPHDVMSGLPPVSAAEVNARLQAYNQRVAANPPPRRAEPAAGVTGVTGPISTVVHESAEQIKARKAWADYAKAMDAFNKKLAEPSPTPMSPDAIPKMPTEPQPGTLAFSSLGPVKRHDNEGRVSPKKPKSDMPSEAEQRDLEQGILASLETVGRRGVSQTGMFANRPAATDEFNIRDAKCLRAKAGVKMITGGDTDDLFEEILLKANETPPKTRLNFEGCEFKSFGGVEKLFGFIKDVGAKFTVDFGHSLRTVSDEKKAECVKLLRDAGNTVFEPPSSQPQPRMGSGRGSSQ